MTDTISKYSIYCNTEVTNVEGWGTTSPTTCYNNNSHSVDTNQISVIETIINANASATTTVTNYKIYCTTEASYIEGWGVTEPTTCYNNNTHSVNLSSVQIIETVRNSEVSIKEDKINIARNVKIVAIHFNNIPAGANSTQDVFYTFPIITSMYSFKYATDDTNKGDEITIAVNPDTTLGLITSDVSPSDTVINAPAALFTYGWPGFNLILTDGTNTDDLGEILSLDSVNGTVTVATAAVNSFSSANTLMKMTLYTLRNMVIGPPQMYAFGEDVVGGAAVPVGTVVKFTYKNNAIINEFADEVKTMIIYLTLLY